MQRMNPNHSKKIVTATKHAINPKHKVPKFTYQVEEKHPKAAHFKAFKGKIIVCNAIQVAPIAGKDPIDISRCSVGLQRMASTDGPRMVHGTGGDSS